MLAGDPAGTFGPLCMLYGRRLINLIGARHREFIAESPFITYVYRLGSPPSDFDWIAIPFCPSASRCCNVLDISLAEKRCLLATCMHTKLDLLDSKIRSRSLRASFCFGSFLISIPPTPRRKFGPSLRLTW